MLFLAFSWTRIVLISLTFAISILNIKPCLPKLLNLTVLIRIAAFSPQPLQGRWVARPTWWVRGRLRGLCSPGAVWGQRCGSPGSTHWFFTSFFCLPRVNFRLWSLGWSGQPEISLEVDHLYHVSWHLTQFSSLEIPNVQQQEWRLDQQMLTVKILYI